MKNEVKKLLAEKVMEVFKAEAIGDEDARKVLSSCYGECTKRIKEKRDNK